MVGSRCAVESRSTDVAVEAVRSKFPIEAPAALDVSLKIVWPVESSPAIARHPLTNGHVSAGRSRCVVEDYLASVPSYEGLQNAAIVGDAGAANNQFASECPASGEMFKVKEAELEVNTMLFTSSDVETFTSLCDD